MLRDAVEYGFHARVAWSLVAADKAAGALDKMKHWVAALRLKRKSLGRNAPVSEHMTILAIHHVQLAMPAGGEARATAFYGAVLGFAEVPKPATLAARGGTWFTNGTVELHLGVEADFRPARKAHPALLVDDLDSLETACRAAGFLPQRDGNLPGHSRFYVADPFGNRLEFLQVQLGDPDAARQ